MKNPALKSLIENLLGAGMKTADLKDGFPENSLIVATRQDDFDMSSNEDWEMEGNKSYPRDVVCFLCKYLLVMSNAMWEAYQKNGKPEMLRCGRCVFKDLLSTSDTGENADNKA